MYRGVVKDGDINALSSKVAKMQSKLDELRETEDELDRLCEAMKKDYERAKKNPENEFYAYVTRDDLIDVFGENSVILTVRNFTEKQTKHQPNENDDEEEHILRVKGRFKKIDVRLVTTDGEAIQQGPPQSDDTATEGESSDKQILASQPMPREINSDKRRTNRRRKPEQVEIRDDDSNTEIDEQNSTNLSNTAEEDREKEERIETAKALLGFRPPKKQRKRNFDDDYDSFESRYNHS